VSYNSIRIERDRNKFTVRATDPAIEKANNERSRNTAGDRVGEWKDPHVEYSFDTKDQVITFITSAIDIALPKDEYSTAFDKLAKEAQGKS
jgi:hypothetical protein